MDKSIELPAGFVPGFSLFTSRNGETASPVTPLNPVPIRPYYEAPTAWHGASYDASATDAVEFQITSASGGPWKPQRSLDGGVTWDACQIRDQANAAYSSFTTAMIGQCISARGRGWFRLLDTASGSTVTGMIRAS